MTREKGIRKREGFSSVQYLLFIIITVSALLVCIVAGSVNILIKDTVRIILDSILGREVPPSAFKALILSVRLPRVICVALEGAALSLCGACM